MAGLRPWSRARPARSGMLRRPHVAWRWLTTRVLLGGFWFLAYVYLTLPDVRVLVAKNPPTTGRSSSAG